MHFVILVFGCNSVQQDFSITYSKNLYIRDTQLLKYLRYFIDSCDEKEKNYRNFLILPKWRKYNCTYLVTVGSVSSKRLTSVNSIYYNAFFTVDSVKFFMHDFLSVTCYFDTNIIRKAFSKEKIDTKEVHALNTDCWDPPVCYLYKFKNKIFPIDGTSIFYHTDSIMTNKIQNGFKYDSRPKKPVNSADFLPKNTKCKVIIGKSKNKLYNPQKDSL